jgi:hypothetical protein
MAQPKMYPIRKCNKCGIEIIDMVTRPLTFVMRHEKDGGIFYFNGFSPGMTMTNRLSENPMFYSDFIKMMVEN